MRVRSTALAIVLVLPGALWAQSSRLTIVHTNDLHAHMDATNNSGMMLGSYARHVTVFRQVRDQYDDVLLLNAGDTFQGTIYFNTYLGFADLAYMNFAQYDAAAVGNHEFDRGPEVFSHFVQSATFPILAANLDVSQEPTLSGRILPSTVITVNGTRYGIVGAVTPDLPTISNIGPNVRMRDLRDSCQTAIDELVSQGIDKIILLTHIGYGQDIQLSKSLRGVDVIVGGHSHTYLCSERRVGMPDPAGPYPTEVKDADGSSVLIVQAWQWGMVVGKITVEFDDAGRVTGFADASPIQITSDISEDPAFASIVKAFTYPVEAKMNEPVGETSTALVRDLSVQSLTQIVADSALLATKRNGAVAAFTNAGGVRADLMEGPINYGQALSVLPFNNTLVVLELKGSEILAALEHGASRGGGLLLPSSRTSYTVTRSAPAGSRVRDVMIAGKRLNLDREYRIAFNSFTASGGDAHVELRDAKGDRVDTGIVDLDAFVAYIKSKSPLKAGRGLGVTIK